MQSRDSRSLAKGGVQSTSGFLSIRRPTEATRFCMLAVVLVLCLTLNAFLQCGHRRLRMVSSRNKVTASALGGKSYSIT